MNKYTEEQEIAENKTVNVINSCTNCEHFGYAKSFIELFFKQFNDQESYNELVILFKTKQQEFNCHE